MVSRLYPGRVSHLTLCYAVSYMLFNIQTKHFHMYECETISWTCRSMFDWALRESVSRSSNPMRSFLSLMYLSALWLIVSLFLLHFHSGASLTLQKEDKLPTHPFFLWCLTLRCASLQAPNPGVICNFHFQGRVLGKQRRETSVRNAELKNHI